MRRCPVRPQALESAHDALRRYIKEIGAPERVERGTGLGRYAGRDVKFRSPRGRARRHSGMTGRMQNPLHRVPGTRRCAPERNGRGDSLRCLRRGALALRCCQCRFHLRLRVRYHEKARQRHVGRERAGGTRMQRCLERMGEGGPRGPLLPALLDMRHCSCLRSTRRLFQRSVTPQRYL
jgi:hypothetical protein